MLLKNEKLQQQTKGQVLWVDEAGLVSSKDMRGLMDLAKKNGKLSRHSLSGDYTQHSSVEAGDAFRLLEKEAGVRLARLTEIHASRPYRDTERPWKPSPRERVRPRKRDSTNWKKLAGLLRPREMSATACSSRIT